MTVRFILGRSGTGKTHRILREMKEELRERPQGTPILYIVPDQMSFISEYELVNTPGLNGMIRAQVFSFTRLAWKILQETGGMTRYHLSDVGLNMMIRKIIEEKKAELSIFRKSSEKPGFIGHVETMLTEFKRYCIEPGDLAAFKENGMGKKVLRDKLADLELIYEEFQSALLGKYLDSEDYFQLLSDQIQHSDLLQDAVVYIDGFHSFTPQEYRIIQQLIERTRKVTIALTVDAREVGLPENELSLFRMTSETYGIIREGCTAAAIPVDEEVMEAPIRYQSGPLAHLEQHYETRPIIPSETAGDRIEFMEASNRRAEIEGVARKIRELARGRDHRYKDIAVLVRNGSDYRDKIETIFQDHDIPYFLDQKRTMLNHPLIELIRSTLEIISSNWRYEPVFRAVKTDLLFPLHEEPGELREKMDRLENYVLAHGVKGDRWVKKDRWKYRRFRGLEHVDSPQTDQEKEIEHEINELRLFISAPIIRLSKRLKKQKTGQEYCETLFAYLEELDIPAKLERKRMEAEENGDLVAAREHDQAWAAVMDLLDQYVEILGGEKTSVKAFASILDTGMEAMKFSLVPPAIDQVIIADLEKSRLAHIKTAFVIGVNEGILPAKVTEDGILSDEDRETLQIAGVKVGPRSRTKLLDEEFVAYKAFTTPGERLIISYPIADEEGKALLPSPLIKRLKELFPEARHSLVVNDPAELDERGQLDYVSHPGVSIAHLTTQLQQKKRGYPVFDFWWDVYDYYVTSDEWKWHAGHVLSSLFHRNESADLTDESSKDLYGEHILASVSRMEMFHGCPFSHFASHGLKLRERELFRLEAPDIGEMFHSALKWISEEVERAGLSWASLSKNQCLLLAKEAVTMLAPKLQHQILLSSNRYHYIAQKLEQIIGRANLILSEHAKASGFVPVGVELGFGPKATLPPFQFKLRNGTQMELQGRIDRVDKAEDQNGVYLRIVDYKSSARDLDMTEVYYGLALQMLTYLDIVLSNSKQFVGKEAQPAGVLYFHVHNPLINSKKLLTLDQIEQEIFKSFKMKGLVLGDSDVIRLMDQTLDTGSSDIISAGIKKDGSLSSRSKAASGEDFQFMRHHVRKMYESSGNRIVSGETAIAPYKLKDRTPCQFCSYKPVCQFDQSLEENEYRVLPEAKTEDIMAKIREEADQ